MHSVDTHIAKRGDVEISQKSTQLNYSRISINKSDTFYETIDTYLLLGQIQIICISHQFSIKLN